MIPFFISTLSCKKNDRMAYNEIPAERVWSLLHKTPHKKKKMFGGIGFLVNGNMSCGILNDDLIIWIGPNGCDDALGHPHAREFDTTGKVMKGCVMVSGIGYDSDKDLSSWIETGIFLPGRYPKNKHSK